MILARKYDFKNLHPGLNQTIDDIMMVLKNLNKENFRTVTEMTGITLQNAIVEFANAQTFESSKFDVDADIAMAGHKLTGLSAPGAAGDSMRATATLTEAAAEDAVSKKHTQNTDTQLDSAGTVHNVTAAKLVEYDEIMTCDGDVLTCGGEIVYAFS